VGIDLQNHRGKTHSNIFNPGDLDMNAPAATGPFKLPPLPWGESALAPVISARTIGLHFGKHHATYVKKLNELVAGTRLADVSLEQVIAETVGKEDQKKIFHNAAQAWNHTLFWNSLRPAGGGAPSGDVARRIESDLGGLERFKQDFANAAVECFGSGWAWLVDRDGKLEILATSDAGTPITMGATPLLTIDVWEHAYYLDYENRRPEFAKAVIDHLLNWDFAQQQLEQSRIQSREAA
jgi:superoxide dismutase, Fe-Mn family